MTDHETVRAQLEAALIREAALVGRVRELERKLGELADAALTLCQGRAYLRQEAK